MLIIHMNWLQVLDQSNNLDPITSDLEVHKTPSQEKDLKCYGRPLKSTLVVPLEILEMNSFYVF